MLNILGSRRNVCDGVTRREVLRAGGAGMLGLTLPQLLQAEALASQATESRAAPKAKSVIFLLVFGGPSQLEPFDLKPEAPEKIRGPFRPIPSRTPGLLISEHLPLTANISDRFRVVRTMSHSFNDHSGGAHYIQTGRRWHVPIGGGFSPTPKDWPSMGSMVEYQDQSRVGLSRALPSYMVVPNSLGRLQQAGQYPRPGEHAGWMGQRYNPLTTKIDKRDLQDNPYWRTCSDEELTFAISGMANQDGITLDRLRGRQTLLSQLNDQRQQLETSGALAGYDAFRQRAFSLVTSEATRQALDIRRETAAVRDRYGRHLFGQSALMARRLIEAGVRYVTVHYDCVDGYSWDSHRNSDDVKKSLLPTFDQAYSALITDLAQRGLLDETLVIATGEMGRTPKGNAQWGRDHWSTLFPAVLAGAGIPGGTTYGRSDKDAAYPVDDPVTPEDLAATVYHALGIDHEMRVLNAESRPTQIVEDGQPVLGLWS
ncbi:MAG: DUF1501 domain-containing protein [Pirellulaceae bacterium]|nr:DUF1501 domain-containing protein [Pirellulaceae bacterium]